MQMLELNRCLNNSFSIIMKKSVPKQPPSKPNKPPVGFGFGDAMFAVKNLTSDYSQFDNPLSFEPKPIFQPPKNPVLKPNLPAKPQASIKPTVMQQKQQSSLPKEVFKISAGNQYKSNTKWLQLNQIQCGNGVFQLTPRKELSRWDYHVFCDGVSADKIVEKPEISFSFNTEDLKQGQLGNCYFIAALGSLAHMPQILRQRVPDFKKYTGLEKSFRVTMFESGKLIEVIVDNLFPNVYVKPVGNDISPMLLQKAYAQVYGSFEVVNLGYAIDAMRDLTGAAIEELSFKDKALLRNKMKQYFESRYGMVIASKVEGVMPGLSAKHSYNVLNYEIIDGEIYLELRDPRGWSKAEFHVPYKLSGKQENGRFWVGEKDLQSNFQMISVGKYMKNYNYFFKAFSEKELTNNTAALFIHPKVQTKAFINLHQRHKKFFDEKFSYNVLRLLVAEVEVGEGGWKVIKTLQVNYKTQQVCSIQLDLQSKTYIIIGQIGSFKKNVFPDQAFTISVYSERRQISFEQVTGNIDIKPLLLNYITNNKQNFQATSKHDCFKYFGQAFGYICVYYQNKGDKQVSEEIIYTVKNIEIGERKIQLLPKQNKLIIHAVLSEQYQCSMKSNTLYK